MLLPIKFKHTSCVVIHSRDIYEEITEYSIRLREYYNYISVTTHELKTYSRKTHANNNYGLFA